MSGAVCIVAIGDEVVSGRTVNYNASLIAIALTNSGWVVSEHVAIPDDPRIMEEVLRERLVQGVTVITTGGLGPTVDDHTRKVIARLFHRPLVFSQTTYDSIQRRFGDDCPTIDDQSLQPQQAILLDNLVGTAPGIFLEDSSLFKGARLFALPGPPLELKDVLYNQVLPSFFPSQDANVRQFRIYGLLESDLNPILERIQEGFSCLRIGIYPSYDTVTVLFSVGDKKEKAFLDEAEVIFRSAVPSKAFLDPRFSLEEQVYHNLLHNNWTVAVAESCTGGAIAARLTTIPGISTVFAGGIVAYQNAVKEMFLDVSPDVIEKNGVVSQIVTELMARSVLAKFHVDVAIATSGYFGPKGASVGTVCYTICTPRSICSETRHFVGSREAVCEKTVQAVLAKLCIETVYSSF